MRLLRTLLGVLLLSASAWAQCLEMTWDTTFVGVEPGEEGVFYTYFENLQAEADSVTVTIEKDVDDGWTVFMCAEGACLLPFITTTRIEVVPEYPDTVSVHVFTNDVVTMGHVHLTAVPDGCPEETHQVTFTVSTDPDGVPSIAPETAQLLHAYPNPFNPSTTIEFTLAHQQQIQLTVYDLHGRQVTQLADGMYSTGSHQLTFDGYGYPSGVYLIALNSANGNHYSKISLIK